MIYFSDILEPTTIVHDIEEDTTTQMVEADDIDIAEDPADPVPPGGRNSSSLLSSTPDPAPDLSLALSTECPPCECLCPPAPPSSPPPSLQPTPGPGATNNSSRIFSLLSCFNIGHLYTLKRAFYLTQPSLKLMTSHLNISIGAKCAG